MLTAWIVWILFRWNKVPPIYHRQRNCQLGTVVVAVLVTIGLSFTPYVDWAAHVGGAIQGLKQHIDIAFTLKLDYHMMCMLKIKIVQVFYGELLY